MTMPPAPLDELWEAIPTGHAPVEDLLARGGAVRRRRRVIAAGAVIGVMLGAVLITGVVHRSTEHDSPVATPPAGTRYVGIGQVVVAVPKGWSDGAASCNSPLKDTVYFPWPQDCVVGPFFPVSSVAISSVLMNDGFAAKPHPDGRLGGHQVVTKPAQCTPGTGPERCVQSFGVPDLHAYFSVNVPRDERHALDRVSAIRNSLTLLPVDQTTVPFLVPESSVESWRAALHSTGLTMVVEQESCPPNASCVGGVVRTSPAAGQVVPRGGTVTLYTMTG